MMSARLWSGTAVLLAIPWLQSDLREGVLAYFGLYVALAIAGGLGAVLLASLQPGSTRKGAGVLLFVVSWTIAVGWQYFQRPFPAYFDSLNAIAAGLGVVLLPVGIAALSANKQSAPGWTFAQVTSLLLLAAPLSDLLALVTTLYITHEGP